MKSIAPFCLAFSVLLLASAHAAQVSGESVVTSGRLSAKFTPEAGMTAVSLDGRTVWTGSTAALTAQWMTLVRNVPTLKVEPVPVKNSDVPIPNIWRAVSMLGAKPLRVTATYDGVGRYTTRQEYANGVAVTVDHLVKEPDVTCRITIENDGRDYFQPVTWMDNCKFLFAGQVEKFMGTSGFYPGAVTYSPVMCLWDSKTGAGINWIEHRCRSVDIHVSETEEESARPERTVTFRLCDPKEGACTRYNPVEPGGRTRYAVTFRFDSTPKDWKHLLTPYKTWFNDYFGPCQYNVDFRTKVMNTPSNAGLITKDNPYGTRGKIDTEGWTSYVKVLEGLKKYPGVASHIIFWALLADPRGDNYRPEFNVMPPITRETMPALRQFCREAQMGFGWFARPNDLPFKETWTTDGGVGWNMFDSWAIRMADERYQDMLKMGCTGFYMDTYGGHVGYAPNDGEANVMFLKHLREMTGPDCLTFIEHGSDAQHVFAMIWPWGNDKLGKRPIGEYSRWLTPGTAEICRISSLEGARRAWEEGGMPIGVAIDDALVALQKQYVNPDWTSKVRPDCKPAKSPVPPAESTFAAGEKTEAPAAK